jgi:hypothetical protein
MQAASSSPLGASLFCEDASSSASLTNKIASAIFG